MFNNSVNDSSTLISIPGYGLHNIEDASIKVGIIREEISTDYGIKYDVEVYLKGRAAVLTCTPMYRFGGVQNYEEYNLRPYKKAVDMATLSYGNRVGDTVIVACVNGTHNEGVILGGLTHAGRTTNLSAGDMAYYSQFNGLQTTIDKSGTYTITNKALISESLDSSPGTPIPPEISDPTAAGNFIEINSDGSTTISDGAKQSIVIDKVGLNTTITSGSCSITLNALESAEFSAPAIKMTAKTDITTSALNTKMESKLGTSIKTLKFAVGNSSFELIDGLIKLIDALGSLVVMSPTGPCNPLQAAPTWTQIMILKTKLTAFKGSL